LPATDPVDLPQKFICVVILCRGRHGGTQKEHPANCDWNATGVALMQVGFATDKDTPAFLAALKSRHDVACFSTTEKPKLLPRLDALIVNADLRVQDNIDGIKKMAVGAVNARKRLFILPKKSHAAMVQAFSLGATDVLAEPVSLNDLLRVIEAQIYFDGDAFNTSDASLQTVFDTATHFASLFSTAAGEMKFSMMDAENTTNEVYTAVSRHGLKKWVDNVRLHHTGTFQHCMLVTGCAVDFGRSLGFSRSDVQRLGLMATLHDMGKARIPVEILDKPGQLEIVERAIIETHPALGCDMLSGVEDVTPEIIDGVRHHHELLDGSGYPDKLRGAQISDLVRMLTISDIFAALIEKRSYKAPTPREDAYNILKSMDGKLEMPLVNAFRRVALDR
jgi:HD-GYP domain-containing protein (c-di-GMP phosphodiesterase class II)